MALTQRIACNGVKPTKAMVYTLAAELVELEGIIEFKDAVIETMKSYDYYYYYYDYYYDYYYYYYYDLIKEKVIALLFLAAIYS